MTGNISCLLDDGRRGFAKTADAHAITDLLGADPIGRAVRLDGAAGFEFA